MNILIVGGSGYLGGRLLDFFSKEGRDRILVASRVSIAIDNQFSHVKTMKIDWESNASLDRLTRQADIIVHVAGMNVKDCEKSPVQALDFNSISTTRLVESAIRQKVKRFIYFSTAHVYKNPLQGVITEESCVSNVHPYAVSHFAGEMALRYAHYKGRIEGVILRLSNAVGAPTQKNANCWMLLVNDLCRQVVLTRKMKLRSSGAQMRNFIAISDVCFAVKHMITLPVEKLGDGVYNLGGINTSVSEMAAIIQNRSLEMLGFKPDIFRPDSDLGCDKGELEYSSEKLKSVGFISENNICSEIDETLCFCNDNFGVNV